MSQSIVGVLVNPRAGTDVRRLLTGAATSTVEEKLNAVRRVVVGALESGADRVLLSRDPFRIAGRATETLPSRERIEIVDHELVHDHRDTVRSIEAFRAAGVAVVVALGGDGTSRAVAAAWPDGVLLPLSTGTNNAFPFQVEPTVAGAAAGLVAGGRVRRDDVAARAKVVHARLDGERTEVALVDAVVTSDPYVGSLELFEPDRLRTAVMAVADPASVGFCGVTGRVAQCSASVDGGVFVRFDSPASAERVVRAPTAPGYFADVGVAEWRRIELAEPVRVPGPGILAVDGERWARLDDEVVFEVRRDGPYVLDPWAAVRAGFG
ncbi:MAG: NAD(+)/NADH kinase [Acidimicrobiales bacterium]|nr:NAD(+)/NADH kinase [Acidimicrobiales bacterium]